ncbi:MAG TPA: LCP family protein [Acidimicrobiales bacterium]|nr:LCP family protein [Acidimicrobiales bacterium]
MSLLRPDEAAPEVVPERPARAHPLRHRIAVGFTVFLAAAVLLVGAGVGYAAVQNSRLEKIDSLNRGKNAPLTKVAKGEPVNILVVGNDSRAFAKDAKDKKAFGAKEVGDSQRSDTMMVMRLDPKNDRATVLSIARDLYVDIEGGGKGRINEAFAKKGEPSKADPDRLVRTIKSNFGITINHYIEIDFGGFREVVNAIGGVKVHFPFPARDEFSGLGVNSTGCVQLDGPAALAYVRSRHYEFKTAKGWQSEGTGDLGRIKRQQDFIKRVLRKSVADGLTNPVTAAKLIEAGIDNVRVDGAFGVGDMKSLASQLRDLNDGRLAFVALTGDPVKIDGADVLKLNPVKAAEVLGAFGVKLPGPTATTRRGATGAAIPAGTDVVLYNGSGRNGLVVQVQGDLQRLGVKASSGGNGEAATATEVRYRAGGESAAQAVGGYLGGEVELVADRTVKAGEVVVLLGRSFDQVMNPKTPATTTPSTAPVAPLTTPGTDPPQGSDPSVTC